LQTGEDRLQGFSRIALYMLPNMRFNQPSFGLVTTKFFYRASELRGTAGEDAEVCPPGDSPLALHRGVVQALVGGWVGPDASLETTNNESG
jgi:hypothetical protein